MTSETYIDFCFVRPEQGNFASSIDELLKSLFAKKKLNWYLEEKTLDQAEMVVAEIKGMSDWTSEEEAIRYIEENAGESFWEYLQGYKMFIYPVKRGCNSCGVH
jgi:predicted metalloprotease with PDZ domain